MCNQSIPLNMTQNNVPVDRLRRHTFSSNVPISSNDTYTQHFVIAQTELYVQFGSQRQVQINTPKKKTVNTVVTTQAVTVSSTLLFVSIRNECSFMNSM